MNDTSKYTEGLAAASNAFASMTKAFQLAGLALSLNWKSAMEAFYKQHRSRLPGSDRTSRLRKKRRTMVLKWINNRFDI